uniref:DNA-directed primase/polymerase protein n=1 Tax=Trypanosoma congolense (strain IL3000) TaxID=1068625 RepID=G0UM49_TRYCI|nr:conserved hypothetical protein [Trypanosoma congolense IL3000]
MLWCRATFAECFSDDKCRLFPTQQQLFDFIDDQEKCEQKLVAEGKQWFPFSVEFPSEEEAVRLLTVRSTNASFDKSSRGFRPLFRRRLPDSTAATAPLPGSKRQHCALREDYSLLYGETPLSRQSRMFLAATIVGIQQVITEIEPQQLHLYEVIREGAPCHLYLDVERESDFSAWRRVVCVDDSADDSSDGDPPPSGAEAHECNDESYMAALRAALWRPPRCCPWNCSVRADNSATTDVLLGELQMFLQVAYPELLAGLASNCAEAGDRECISLSGRKVGDNGSVGSTGKWPMGPEVDVLVMRSVQQLQSGGKDRVKFSQHYVIKFSGRWFQNNGSVGRLVSQFIDYLYERVLVSPKVHKALFYHESPKYFPVLQPGDAPNLPFLPLRCIIDSGVYSRNRTMRCLGSCKLHKSGVFTVERTTETVTDMVSLFLVSLITLPLQPRTVIVIPGPAETYSPTGTLGPSSRGGANAQQLLPKEVERYAALVKYVVEQWSAMCGDACSVSSARRCGDRYLLLTLKGSRYCGNVGRQHRSNNVYLSVDLKCGVWFQKCFDPECAGFRGAPQPFPMSAVGLQSGPLISGGWTDGARAVALASHASLRTKFNVPQSTS